MNCGILSFPVKNYAAAAEGFQVCQQTAVNDTVVQIYLERCKAYLNN